MPFVSGNSALIDARPLFERVGLRVGQHVADLGCGVTGHYIIPAARIIGGEGKAYAVDIQKSALAATESRAKLEGLTNITTVWSDLERIGATHIPAGTLDLAILSGILHLTSARTAVLRETARLLKSGGHALIIEWKPEATGVGPAAAARASREVVRTAAKAAGLTEQSTFEAGPYHYAMMFTKP